MSCLRKSPECPLFKEIGVHNRVLAIDLDDTLFSNHFPDIGDPLPSVKTRMERVRELGCRITIHTSRISPRYGEERCDQLKMIQDALHKHGIAYDEIWTRPGKPLACAYIDDKAFRSVAAWLAEADWEEGRR